MNVPDVGYIRTHSWQYIWYVRFY